MQKLGLISLKLPLKRLQLLGSRLIWKLGIIYENSVFLTCIRKILSLKRLAWFYIRPWASFLCCYLKPVLKFSKLNEVNAILLRKYSLLYCTHWIAHASTRYKSCFCTYWSQCYILEVEKALESLLKVALKATYR